jgi:ubiquinone/menaquinone biosynthesis C-methylase UbiE
MRDLANREQFANWNGESGANWVANADQRDAALAPVLDALMDAAGLEAGQRVLDVGCGCGATTLAAAKEVGASGHAVGLDLSESMLDVARRRATHANTANVEFLSGDVQVYDLGRDAFDVVLSRFGTMFFNDPVAAFSNLAAALSDNGRLCIVTWQPFVANEWLSVPFAALLRYGSMPNLGDGPGMFSQSEPKAIRATLEQAGFAKVTVAPSEMRLLVGRTVDEALRYVTGTGIGRAVLATIAPEEQTAALDAVTDVLSEHADSSGVHLPGAILITTAVTSTPANTG